MKGNHSNQYIQKCLKKLCRMKRRKIYTKINRSRTEKGIRNKWMISSNSKLKISNVVLEVNLHLSLIQKMLIISKSIKLDQKPLKIILN